MLGPQPSARAKVPLTRARSPSTHDAISNLGASTITPLTSGPPKAILDVQLREAPGHFEAIRFESPDHAASWWNSQTDRRVTQTCLIPAHTTPPAKRRSLVAVDITDFDGFVAYATALDDVVTSYGGTLLGSRPFPPALGQEPPPHAAALMAWDDQAMAKDFYESAHYRPHRDARHASSKSLIIVVDRPATTPAPSE